jgi:hypothetical protein
MNKPSPYPLGIVPLSLFLLPRPIQAPVSQQPSRGLTTLSGALHKVMAINHTQMKFISYFLSEHTSTVFSA